MDTNIDPKSQRIVKVPLPIPLIRRMDVAIVAERGGFRTRAELIGEAVDNLLAELEFPDTSMGAGPVLTDAVATSPRSPAENGRSSIIKDLVSAVPSWERDELTLGEIAGTALKPPPIAPHLLAGGEAKTPDQPLLGLHNRDYVSLWAAHRLARYTSGGPVEFEDFMRRLTAAAWYFGAQLHDLALREERRGLTVLLPTNTAKQPSAVRGFQAFAVGTVARRAADRELAATGPLFAWGMIQATQRTGLLVGLTEAGWALVRDLDGLSLDLPHSPPLMEAFLTYLAAHAPADRWGFDHVLCVVADAPDRDSLVASFSEAHPEWTGSTASSVAQGYVARAREWGLIAPKLVEGRYWLTDTGRNWQSQSGSPVRAHSDSITTGRPS